MKKRKKKLSSTKRQAVLKKPLISFCISTYQRFDLLERMLTELQKQTYPHFEVVICDNDPKASSKKIAAKFKKLTINYQANPKNLGMVDSFNRAYEHSKGNFIIFMSDDDPPYPTMLEELVSLYHKHPKCDSYFSAYDLYTPEAELAQKIKMPQGYLSCRNRDWPQGAVKIFSPKNYLKKALKGEIFYYLMWSAGMVKREVVAAVEAIPSYGSALMTDRSYCLKVGARGKTLIYNKELASQLVHNQSFSLTSANAEILTKGFVGYYNDIQPYLKGHDLEKENQQFLIRHLINMFMIIKVGSEGRGEPTDVQFLMKVFDAIAAELPFVAPYRWKMRLMLWKRLPFEIIFKAMDMSPAQFYKTVVRFIRYRAQ